MRLFFVLFFVSFLCFAHTSDQIQLIRSHIEALRRPKTNDLFALSKSFLLPFPSVSERSVSKSSLSYLEARKKFIAGDLVSARAILQKLPQNTHPFQKEYLLGAINAQEGQLSKAKLHFQKISYFKSDSGADLAIAELALKALALIAEHEGDYEKSVTFLKQLARFDIHSVQDQTLLQQQEANYDILKQELIQILGDTQIRLEKQKHPELEIPLTPGKNTTVLLDKKIIYSSQKIEPGTLLSFPVSFGLHQLSINNLEYWLVITLDSNFEVHFDFVDTKLGVPEQPVLSN
ncbi:MAG: hypothetical protein WCK42_09375, partial [Myxococcaceae bacterium]